MALTVPVLEIIEKIGNEILGKHASWERILLGEIAVIINGGAFESKDFSLAEGMPLIRIRDIVNGVTKTYFNGQYDEKYLINQGDLLIGMDGDFNLARWKGAQALLNQRVCKVILNCDKYNSSFLEYVLPLYLKAINNATSSVTVKHLSSKTIQEIPLPLPPLAEQNSIVAEIEKQFSRLDEAVAGLKRIQINLKRYRASVLKSAVEGKLTAEWRKQHSNTEPAEQLLARILKERRVHWEQAELQKMQASGKPPKDELWKQKYKEPVKPDVSDLPALPDGWVWATPEQLASINNYSLAIGPFGSNLKVSDYCQEGVPLIFVKNIRSKSFDGEKTKYVTETKAYELTPHKVNPGDILITKMGEPPGDACLYPLTCPPAIITADCIKWKLVSLLDNVFFFIYAINSQPLKLQIQKITKGVAQQKISLGRFKSLVIPLPSLQEQAKIVSEVERRLSITDEVEQQININLKRAERLRQAILKKAFSGRLVPQDPNDEPASVLLEKIKQAQLA